MTTPWILGHNHHPDTIDTIVPTLVKKSGNIYFKELRQGREAWTSGTLGVLGYAALTTNTKIKLTGTPGRHLTQPVSYYPRSCNTLQLLEYRPSASKDTECVGRCIRGYISS